jgi:hypothetical protein
MARQSTYEDQTDEPQTRRLHIMPCITRNTLWLPPSLFAVMWHF